MVTVAFAKNSRRYAAKFQKYETNVFNGLRNFSTLTNLLLKMNIE